MSQLLRQEDETATPDFRGLGKSLITKAARTPLASFTINSDRLENRKLIRTFVPSQPGVYGWLDERQQIIYIGKSKALQSRLLQYFAKSAPDPKMERIRDQSLSVVWEATSHELLALLREQELIVNHRPSMNVQGQPHRRQPGFVSISEGPAPKAYLARTLTPRTRKWFGPISGTGQLNAAIVSLNYAFNLRDCADNTAFRFNNQLQLFERKDNAKCLRFELNTCPGPCAGACSTKTYSNNVQNAIDFLNGEPSIVAKLESEMKAHADKQSFERAAVLRDQIDGLDWISRQLARLREAEELLNGVYQLPGLASRPVWLWLRRGEIIGCHPKSRTIPKSILQQLDQKVEHTNLTKNLLYTYFKMLMVAWFRKHPEEKRNLLGVARVSNPNQAAA